MLFGFEVGKGSFVSPLQSFLITGNLKDAAETNVQIVTRANFRTECCVAKTTDVTLHNISSVS